MCCFGFCLLGEFLGVFFFVVFFLFLSLAFMEILVVHVLPHWELHWAPSGWVGNITGLLNETGPADMGTSLPPPR